MRTISSIRTAALVVALAATACSQRAEPRPPPSQDRTTMNAFGPDAVQPVIAMPQGFDEAVSGRGAEPSATVVDPNRILDAVLAGADREGRPS